MSGQPANRGKWPMRLLKLVIVLIVLWFVRDTILTAIEEIRKQPPATLRPAWLVAAGFLYLAGTLPPALFWHRILRALGQRPPLAATLRAFMVGHLGKYVPGKAMVVVIRAGMLRGRGADPAVAAAAVFLETLTMMAVGGFLAAAILLITRPQHALLVTVAVALMLASGLPTLPPLFRRLVRVVLRKLPAGGAHVSLDGITYRLMATGWLANVAAWGLLGASLWATLRALGVAQLDLVESLPLLTASAALAVVAGFLSLIPGGFGIRELILAEVMVPQFGEVLAVLSAVCLRLVWLLAELAISGILYPAGKAMSSPPPETDPTTEA